MVQVGCKGGSSTSPRNLNATLSTAGKDTHQTMNFCHSTSGTTSNDTIVETHTVEAISSNTSIENQKVAQRTGYAVDALGRDDELAVEVLLEEVVIVDELCVPLGEIVVVDELLVEDVVDVSGGHAELLWDVQLVLVEVLLDVGVGLRLVLLLLDVLVGMRVDGVVILELLLEERSPEAEDRLHH
eukprot:6475993-Amphidinium_carterae.1